MDAVTNWLETFSETAVEAGDYERLELCDLLNECFWIGEEEHALRLARFGELADRARALNEPWWVAYATYWQAEIWLFWIHNPKKALEIAARLVVEIRKPIYDAFPARGNIELNFLACYQHTDPVFYASQLREALARIRPTLDKRDDSWLLFQQTNARFHIYADQPGALQAAFEHLDAAMQNHLYVQGLSAHYVIYALLDIFQAHARHDFARLPTQLEALGNWALELAKKERNQRLVAAFYGWLSLERRFANDEKSALQFQKRALQTQRKLSPPRHNAFFPLALEREVAGDFNGAIRFLESEITELEGLGQEFWIGLRAQKIADLQNRRA